MSKTTRIKSSSTKSARRRQDLRRNLPKRSFNPVVVLQSRKFFNIALIMVIMLVFTSLITIWSREQVKVRDGQIMTTTRIKRLDYSTLDAESTNQKREEARRASPRIYTLNEQYLSELDNAIRGLPRALANTTSLEEVDEDLIANFKLDEAGLRELRHKVNDEGQLTNNWNRIVDRLMFEMRQRPLIESVEYQRYTTNPAAVQMAGGEINPLPGDRGIKLMPDSDADNPALNDLVRRVGFHHNIIPIVIAWLKSNPQPVAVFDRQLTDDYAERVAANVQDVLIAHHKGDVIYRRGEILDPTKFGELVTEMNQYDLLADPVMVWQTRFGLIGLVTLALLFISVFLFIYYHRVAENMLRVLAIMLLMIGMLCASVLVTVQAPKIIMFGALAPTLFVAIVMLLAYDKRLAVITGGMQCVLVVLALELSIGWFLVLIVGCGTVIVQLNELRHRSSLFRAATVTAIMVGVSSIALGLLELPISVAGITNGESTSSLEGLATLKDVTGQIMRNMFWAVMACYCVGFVVLGLLPSIERLFDITTGMTLAELRDPRQPLLRQLQQKAPGSYNHSLQVGNIAEAAADAIGADSLLVYVGAMYHDIGKMSKPEYFIENQTGKYNKHDKLSPAMSLLVIIGHVKDGIELGKEYGLPRALQHFIESPHGTTLVEYFYHAAKTQEQVGDRKDTVEEVEFRYPGPKPKTKEAAILMLSDAVESATRAMAEPNPSRIESLVRELSRKRLTDGQFDQCDLTFRELGLVEDAIISRVGAIHHGRIAYPSGKASKSEDEARPPSAKTASA